MEEDFNSCIIDSSFMLAHLLPDEDSEKVQEFFDRLKKKPIRLIAPNIFPFEVFNGIQTAIIRKRVEYKLAKNLGEKFLKISVTLKEIDLLEVSTIAYKYTLTIYDASYFYLYRKLNLPFLTLDDKLKKLSKT